MFAMCIQTAHRERTAIPYTHEFNSYFHRQGSASRRLRETWRESETLSDQLEPQYAPTTRIECQHTEPCKLKSYCSQNTQHIMQSAYRRPAINRTKYTFPAFISTNLILASLFLSESESDQLLMVVAAAAFGLQRLYHRQRTVLSN